MTVPDAARAVSAERRLPRGSLELDCAAALPADVFRLAWTARVAATHLYVRGLERRYGLPRSLGDASAAHIARVPAEAREHLARAHAAAAAVRTDALASAAALHASGAGIAVAALARPLDSPASVPGGSLGACSSGAGGLAALFTEMAAELSAPLGCESEALGPLWDDEFSSWVADLTAGSGLDSAAAGSPSAIGGRALGAAAGGGGGQGFRGAAGQQGAALAPRYHERTVAGRAGQQPCSRSDGPLLADEWRLPPGDVAALADAHGVGSGVGGQTLQRVRGLLGLAASGEQPLARRQQQRGPRQGLPADAQALIQGAAVRYQGVRTARGGKGARSVHLDAASAADAQRRVDALLVASHGVDIGAPLEVVLVAALKAAAERDPAVAARLYEGVTWVDSAARYRAYVDNQAFQSSEREAAAVRADLQRVRSARQPVVLTVADLFRQPQHREAFQVLARGLEAPAPSEQAADAAAHAAEYAVEAASFRQLLAAVDVLAALPEPVVEGGGAPSDDQLACAAVRAVAWRFKDLYGLCEPAAVDAAVRGAGGGRDQHNSGDGWDSDGSLQRFGRSLAGAASAPGGSASSDEGGGGGVRSTVSKADAVSSGADGLPRLRRRPKVLPTTFVDASLQHAVAAM
jgi:hypothetical protein